MVPWKRQPCVGDVRTAYSARFGNVSGVQDLISSGVNVQASQNWALYEAAKSGHIAVVEMLLSAGANINGGRSSHHTPLKSACESGNAQLVQLLITRGVQEGSLDGLLHAQCYPSRSEEVFDVLLAAGADVNDNNGVALSLASSYGRTSLVKKLLASGADLNLWNSRRALMRAEENHHDDISALLRAAGATDGPQPGMVFVAY